MPCVLLFYSALCHYECKWCTDVHFLNQFFCILLLLWCRWFVFPFKMHLYCFFYFRVDMPSASRKCLSAMAFQCLCAWHEYGVNVCPAAAGRSSQVKVRVKLRINNQYLPLILLFLIKFNFAAVVMRRKVMLFCNFFPSGNCIRTGRAAAARMS